MGRFRANWRERKRNACAKKDRYPLRIEVEYLFDAGPVTASSKQGDFPWYNAFRSESMTKITVEF